MHHIVLVSKNPYERHNQTFARFGSQSDSCRRSDTAPCVCCQRTCGERSRRRRHIHTDHHSRCRTHTHTGGRQRMRHDRHRRTHGIRTPCHIENSCRDRPFQPVDHGLQRRSARLDCRCGTGGPAHHAPRLAGRHTSDNQRIGRGESGAGSIGTRKQHDGQEPVFQRPRTPQIPEKRLG